MLLIWLIEEALLEDAVFCSTFGLAFFEMRTTLVDSDLDAATAVAFLGSELTSPARLFRPVAFALVAVADTDGDVI